MVRFRYVLPIVFSLLICTTSSADDSVAKAYFEKGTKLYNLGEYTKALELFKSAYLERADPAFLFNIAQCQRQMSDFSAAEKSYRAYLREANPPPDQRAAVQRLIDSMEQAAKEQRQKQPPTGIEQPTVGPTETTTPRASPAPATGTLTLTPSEDVSSAGNRLERRLGIGLSAAGAVLIGVGGVFYGVAKSANDGAGADGVYHPDAISRRNTFQALEASAFAVGGAAIVTGIVLYVVGRRSSHATADGPRLGHLRHLALVGGRF